MLSTVESIQVGTHNQSVRERWLENALAQIPAGGRILDAGAGQLQYKPFCSHLNYVSQDFSQYDGSGNGVGLQKGGWNQEEIDIISDITNIPEPDSSFDAIMCVEVIEHVPNPVDSLKELTRLLRPGGYLILTAPFSSLTHYAPYYYYSGFSKYFYEFWLQDLNFDIIEIEWNGNYFEFLAQELRRLPDVSKRYIDVDLAENYKFRLAIDQILGILNQLSIADTSSHELLSFGFHILAKKKS